MKKITTLLLIGFFSLSAYSQEKFTGIGKLKIGVDTSIIADLVSENSLKKIKIKTFKDFLKVQSGKNYGKINYVDGVYFADATEAPGVSVYQFGEIKIAGIPIEKVVLKFYNNQLYSFDSQYSKELLNAMKTKYPDFEESSKKDTTSCINKATGNKLSLESTMFHKKWKNGTITALATIGNYYNDKCEDKLLSFVQYNDHIISDQVRDLEQELSKQKETKKAAETKAKLSDF